MIFEMSLDGSGSGLETFLFFYRQVLEGFGKYVRRGPKIEIFKNGWEYFS